MAKLANTMLVILVVLVAVIGGAMTNWYGLVPAETVDEVGKTPAGTTGDLGSLKYSVMSVTEDSPVQFAGTGYCWDKADPTVLIETISGKTLSKTAGTTFGPAFRGHSYECTNVDTTHLCEHAEGKMTDEGLALRSDCKNLTNQANMQVSFFEKGTLETTNSIDLGANAIKSYNKWAVEINGTKRYYEIGAVCFGTNVSSSNLDSIKITNWVSDVVPNHLNSVSDDWCYTPPSDMKLTSFEYKEISDSIVFDADGTGTGSTEEKINVTIKDKCEYVARDGSIKTDYFKRDSVDQTDCGAEDLAFTITAS